MATLSEFEVSCTTMPSWQKGLAAGPAYALRQAINAGEPFIASRDRLVNAQQHRVALSEAESLATFSALSGP